jgi:hypothetical protein
MRLTSKASDKSIALRNRLQASIILATVVPAQTMASRYTTAWAGI